MCGGSALVCVRGCGNNVNGDESGLKCPAKEEAVPTRGCRVGIVVQVVVGFYHSADRPFMTWEGWAEDAEEGGPGKGAGWMGAAQAKPLC